MTASIQPTSRRLDLATGLGYHVLEWQADASGDGDHTVILVHGILDLAWSWQPVVEAGLAGRFHLVAPDMRGHGDSDRVGAGGYYHFMDYLADLDDVVTQLGRGRVSLVGHSMGGGVCSYFAGTFPDRVHRLALLEGVGPPELDLDMPGRIRRWLDSWRAARVREPRGYASVDEAAERLRIHDRLLGPELARFLAEHGTRPLPDGRVRFKHDPLHMTLGPYPFRIDLVAGLWRAITCPVLLVEGGQSELLGRIGAEELARRYAHFSDRRRLVLDGAGHMLQRHEPAALAAALAEFLAGA